MTVTSATSPAGPEPLPVPGTATPLPPPPADTAGPATMQRRLWVLLPLVTLSISLVWGGVLQALIALQVSGFVADPARQATTLGIVLAVGAVCSTLVTPVLGMLSDRTRSRFGRRNVWIAGAGALGAAMLVLTAVAPSTMVLAIVWALALIPLNGFQAAVSAVVPERVPVRIRARLTATIGMAMMVGIGAGASIGSLVPVVTAYVILASQLVLVGLLFAFSTQDYAPPLENDAARRTPAVKLPGFRSAPDFWLVFVGRFLTMLAYGMATGLTIYALRDHFGAGDGTTDAARQLNGSVVVPLTTALIIVSAIIGGVLADKLRRMKLFVVMSSALFVPGALVLITVPTATGAIVGLAIMGFGLGSYISVDGALITMVLPNLEGAGRDLGILNIANAGPQIIAPVVAGGIVATAGYPWLYAAVIVSAALGSLAVVFVKSVR